MTPREELTALRRKIHEQIRQGEKPSDEDLARLEHLSEQTGLAEEIDLGEEDLGEEPSPAEVIDAALLSILDAPRNEEGELLDPEKTQADAERICALASKRNQE